jgi:hypothetical protein
MARNMDVIWGKGEAIYFSEKDWTGSISLIRFRKLAVARRAAGGLARRVRARHRLMTVSAVTRRFQLH